MSRNENPQPPSPRGRTVLYVVLGVVFLVVVVGLLAALAGAFHRKIAARGPTQPAVRPAAELTWQAARSVPLPATESAVGTIRAVHETSVASKLLAKVRTVRVTAGREVQEGETLVELDDADLRARAQQAEAAVSAATAIRDQARIELERVERLRQQNAASPIEFDRAASTLKTADAEVQRAEEMRNEAATILDYATIRAPLTGIVVDKRVDVGDTVTPGQVVATLYNPQRMQLVASVRESLARQLAAGQDIGVHVDALNKTCMGRISEIVPEAQTASRSFEVKVTGPCPPGIYSGMFGRLLIPLGTEEVLVVPRQAVRQVGQLSVVEVRDGQAARRRAVQLGRSFGDDVEILSGLRPGEEVAVHPQGG
ncbi:MAG TPA: efflux RND transporter periplasmic adaptor subunit [Phycisphaerae bacterium]|nr:efflux RND transporter periplasmic adaptor subunit [Phycisphaerae bacterium]HNU45372.1 efflux RND transporter periplasmic adaptor subunit [Phycisphaerae bacterium]